MAAFIDFKHSVSRQSSCDSCEHRTKPAHSARVYELLSRIINELLSKLCCVSYPPDDLDWGENLVQSDQPLQQSDYCVCSLVSDLGANIAVYFRSEEPVSLTMDISTGHTVLVSNILDSYLYAWDILSQSVCPVCQSIHCILMWTSELQMISHTVDRSRNLSNFYILFFIMIAAGEWSLIDAVNVVCSCCSFFLVIYGRPPEEYWETWRRMDSTV